MSAQRGFVMLAVMVALVSIAAIALMLSAESALQAELGGRAAEALEAEYAAEAAMAHAIWQAEQSDCSAYSLPATNFGAHSYSAAYSPAGGSPTAITATATLADGVARSVSRAALPVFQSTIQQVVRQPGAAAGVDTWMVIPQTGWNHGVDNELRVSATRRGLLAFSYLGVPYGARVKSAMLGLWANTGNSGTVSVFRVINDWIEGSCNGSGCSADGATWATTDGSTAWLSPSGGGDFDSVPVASTDNPVGNAWNTWDITALVRQWADGTIPNQGMLIGGSDGVDFASSDEINPALRPKLTIDFSCECGIVCTAPSGSGRLLLVISNLMSPDPADTMKQSVFESWGYTVDLIADAATQIEFDTAFASHDAVFVSETVSPTALGTKLAAAPIAIVSEEGLQNDELGISTGINRVVGNTITVTDNSHYISQPFPLGALRILSAPMEGLAVGTGAAPDLRSLGQWGSAPGLAVLEAGGNQAGGGTVPATRIMLPLGRYSDDKTDWRYLNNNGRLLVQRAIQWAVQAGAAPVAYWKLDDTGSTAADTQGSNDGTLNGGTWVAGQSNGALSLNGTNEYVEVPNDSVLDLVNEFTLLAWVRASDLTGRRVAVSKGRTAGGGRQNYWLGTNGTDISLGWDNGTVSEFTAAASLQLGQWYRIAGTFNDAANEWKIFLDGALVGSGSTTAAPSSVNGPVYLGRSIEGEYWAGELDDVRLYDRALNAPQ